MKTGDVSDPENPEKSNDPPIIDNSELTEVPLTPERTENISIPADSTETAGQQQIVASITFTQLLTAIAVSLVSLVLGFATAYTSPANPSLKENFLLDNAELSWIGSLLPLNAVIGGLIGAVTINYCGRKGTLLIISMIFLVSWILIYCAENFYEVCAGRCLAGASVGLASLTLPIYLIETVQTAVRGTLGLLPMTFGNMGIVLCYAYGMFVDWRELAAIGAMFSLPFPLFLLWIIPESPSWYVANNKLDKCRKALKWLRGNSQDITKELDELVRQHNQQKSRGRRISKLLKKPHLKSLAIIFSLMIVQQFSGINAVIFYTTTIFDTTDGELSSITCTTIVGAVNMISSFLANGIINRFGRKLSLQLSSAFMTLGLGCLGFYYYMEEILDEDVFEFGFLPLTSLSIFVVGFSIGFGPVPWLLLTDIIPLEVRGVATAMATTLNWVCTFLITLTFLPLVDMFGYFALFWFYCSMVLIGGVLTWLFVPEVNGMSQMEMGTNSAVQQIPSAATNTKPFPSTIL